MKEWYFETKYRFFNFLKRYEETIKKIFVVVVIVAIVLYLYYLQPLVAKSEMFAPISEIFSIALGFFLATSLHIFKDRFKKVFEDELKVNHSYSQLNKQYQNLYDYSINNNKEQVFKYHCIFANTENNLSLDDIIIEDEAVQFVPPVFVEQHISQLISCHKASYVTNSMLLRLKGAHFDKENRKLVLKTMRTKNIYSLCMNRACDYSVDGLTLRQLYESFPRITSLEESVFSNHIGIQVLIRSKDGYIALVKRKFDSTVSKNGLCASFATKYSTNEVTGSKNKDIKSSYRVTTDILLKWILDKLNAKFANKGAFTFERSNLKFLGLGQELYECGRPQMFFMYDTMKNRSELEEILDLDDSSNNNYNSETEMYFVKPKDIEFDKETRCTSLVNYYYKNKKIDKNVFKLIEDACLASIWHMAYYNNHRICDYSDSLDVD